MVGEDGIETTVFPLNAAQKGIWLGQGLAPSSARYNTAEYVRIHGPLQKNKFVTAIKHVLGQAEGLHINFDRQQPVYYCRPVNVQLIEQDFSFGSGSVDEKMHLAMAWMKANCGQGLNIYAGQLFDTALLKLADDEWIAFLKIHHIAADGYSYILLFNALFHTYEKLTKDAANPTSVVGGLADKLFDPFHKAVSESLQYPSTDTFKNDEHYWRSQLTSMVRPVSFADTNAEISDDFLRCTAEISSADRQQFEQLAKINGVSWPELLMAIIAHMLCLQRATTRVSIGIPLMNRMGTSARVPMMQMNIAPLVVTLTDGATLLEQAQALAQRLRQDRPHHRYRYESMRAFSRKITPENDGRIWGPVINILPFSRRTTIGDLRLDFHNVSAGPVEDISFTFLLTTTHGLKLQIDANPKIYDISTITQLSESIVTSIKQGHEQSSLRLRLPSKPFSWLAATGFDDRQQKTPLAIWQKIKSIATIACGHTALEDDHTALSYPQLVEKVEHLACQFESSGLVAGDRCVLMLPRSIQAILSCLACIKNQYSFIFIDSNAPPERVKSILDDCQPNLVLVHEINTLRHIGIEALPVPLAVLDEHDAMVAVNSVKRAAHAVDSATQALLDGAAYIIYTSGSTGRPKGVVVGRQALSHFVQSAIRSYGLLPTDRVLQFSPLHFDACIEEIFCSLSVGATLVLRNDTILDSMANFCHYCEKRRISFLDLPTAFWHEWVKALVGQSLPIPKRLRSVIIGGEAVNDEQLTQWLATVGRQVKLFNSYGPTEATVVATVEPLHELKQNDIVQVNSTAPLGKPLAGRAIMVADERGQILPRGKNGELYLLGSGLANGYLHLEEATARAFVNVRLPWMQQTQRAYRTGDRVILTDDDELHFCGRIDNEIKISGQRISPREIELALEGLPPVDQAVVTVVKQRNTTLIVAHLQGRKTQDHFPTIDVLRHALRKTLPGVMLPKHVLHYDGFPLNASGKVDRLWLSAKGLSAQGLSAQQSVSRRNQPQNQAEESAAELEIMRRLWQEFLGNIPFTGEDNFFTLGGESLQVIQLANRLSVIRNRTVSGALLFKNPTLTTMTQAVFHAHRVESEGSSANLAITRKLSPLTIEAKIIQDIKSFQIALDQEDEHRKSDKLTSNTVIVTGATGFVGAHIVADLLAHTQSQVICLIRADSLLTAQTKLKDTVAKYRLDLSIESLLQSRLTIVLTDLQKPNIGFTRNACKALCEKASTIIHAAAKTSVTRDYDSLRDVNTLATASLTLLAKRFNLRLCYISTIAVAPPKSSGQALREDFVDFHSALADGYQQSKWAAETMVKHAISAGVDARIYRLGRVTGSLKNYYVNRQDLVWQIILTSLRIGCLPDLNIAEPWTPVDQIAGFIVQNQSLPGEVAVFNLVTSHRVHFQTVCCWLQQSNPQLEKVAVSEWLDKIQRSHDPSALILATFFEQKHQAQLLGQELPTTDIQSHQFLQQLHQQAQAMSDIKEREFSHYCRHARNALQAEATQAKNLEQMAGV